jgi:ThiF family
MGTALGLSRPIAAAQRLGEVATDRHRFFNKRVLITGEPNVMSTANGMTILDASLRLLVRLCPNLSVFIPPECANIREAARETARQIAFGRSVEFLEAAPGESDFDAALNVGSVARPNLPWTVVNSNGWLARVSSGCSALASECSHTNPIAALFAASLGSAEVFKRLIGLKPERGVLLDLLSFNLLTYESGSDGTGPSLPGRIPLEVLLVGSGAIGNGVVYLLRRLPAFGRIWIVDRDVFKHENLGTCVLIGPADLGREKALFAASLFDGELEACGFAEELSVFKQRLGGEVPYPQVVLGAVDSIEARHEIQDMWPDFIIDGAIGDFPCQVSRHRWGVDEACLRCLFRPLAGEPAEVAGSRATGLPPERVSNALDVVTERDVIAAPPDKRALLQRNLGRQICSVVAEAMAQQISLESQRPGFEPSVPFVACLSACMVVAELVKATLGWPSSLETRFQWDTLRGPHRGQQFAQGRRPDCLCVERRSNIQLLRDRRQAQPQLQKGDIDG